MNEKGGERATFVRDPRVEPYLYKSRSRKFVINIHKIDQCLPALYPKEQVDIHGPFSRAVSRPCSSDGMLNLVDKAF
jgi:hypothetical protein